MMNKLIGEKGGTQKGGRKGGQMWGAHRLSAEQRNAAIKPEKKKKRV